MKQDRRAIAIDATSASFYSNLGAALFSKKEFEWAVAAYAVEIDPNVFVVMFASVACRRSCLSSEDRLTTTTPWLSCTRRWILGPVA